MRSPLPAVVLLAALACQPVRVGSGTGGESQTESGGRAGDGGAGGVGGCGGIGNLNPYCEHGECDLDGDGFLNAECGGNDCNDKNPEIYPGAPEVCGNDRDDDCNGVIDEGCACAPGDRRSCYPAFNGGIPVDPRTQEVGACADGEQICNDDGTSWSDCSGTVTPIGEGNQCDGIDQDCDGLVDEGLSNACGVCAPKPIEICGNGFDDDCNGVIDDFAVCARCAVGEQRICYSGPPQTLGKGSCHTGTATCDLNANRWSRCEEEQLPRFEACGNGEDDDCDGLLDEDDGATGKRCRMPCVAEGPEICGDGLDNDCDGRADEGCLAMAKVQDCYPGPPATRRVGVCRDGHQDREGAYWGDCLGSVVPQPERCGDGIDSDCNGLGGPGEPEDPGC